MAAHRRRAPAPDQMTTGILLTIATRTWTPPEGAERDARMAELRDRVDLLVEAAGVLLGARLDDEHDPHYRQATAGAEMLLEVAGVPERDPAGRCWPEAPGAWATPAAAASGVVR